MNGKITLQELPGNVSLVAEASIDLDYPEIFVFLEKDGVVIQDLAVIGNRYHYDDADLSTAGVVLDEGFSVKVYSDHNNEDYTHSFDIDIHKD